MGDVINVMQDSWSLWTWGDVFQVSLTACWLVASVAVLITIAFPSQLKTATLHGKLRINLRNSDEDETAVESVESVTAILDRLLGATVPKRWFLHFYVVAWVWNAGLMKILVHLYTGELYFAARFFVGPLLFQIHASRRLYEAWKMYRAPQSHKSRMTITGYIVGLLFYIGAPLTIAHNLLLPTSSSSAKHISSYQFNSETYTSTSWIISTIGVIIFIWASYHQYIQHDILFQLSYRSKYVNGVKQYGMPMGDWFNWVSSPHYLAEVMIYFALLLENRSLVDEEESFDPAAIAMLCFVLFNLGLTADATHSWYIQKFDERYLRHRKRMVPWLY